MPDDHRFEDDAPFAEAARVAAAYRRSLPESVVAPPGRRRRAPGRLRRAGRPPDPSPLDVLDELVAAAEGGLVGSAGPRFFGFVIGGALPAATAADVLAAGWDQCAFNAMLSPAAVAAEEAAGTWLKELLGIPAGASVGFVTGAQAANTVGLAAARHHVLAEAGLGRRAARARRRARPSGSWPARSATPPSTGRCGCSAWAPASLEPVAADAQRRDRRRRPASGCWPPRPPGPTIVVPPGGQRQHRRLRRPAGGHARAAHAPRRLGARRRRLRAVGGRQPGHPPPRRRASSGADSWGCDGHKWLNVPYDCGYAFCAHPDVARARRCPTPRPTWSAGRARPGLAADLARRVVPPGPRLRHLGRPARARAATAWPSSSSGAAPWPAGSPTGSRPAASRSPTRSVLNQVLVGFGDDDRTDRVIDAVQRDGTCWMGGTTWRGRRLMRISVVELAPPPRPTSTARSRPSCACTPPADPHRAREVQEPRPA